MIECAISHCELSCQCRSTIHSLYSLKHTPRHPSPSNSFPSNTKALKLLGEDRQRNLIAHTMVMCVFQSSDVDALEFKKVMLRVVEWWNSTKNARS